MNFSRLLHLEKLAQQVYDCMGGAGVPVDVLGIAREEGIQLAPGNYGADFHGRLEFHRASGIYILFHPEPSCARYPAVMRFSIAHELGHYYITEHVALLRAGQFHSSTPGFVCDNQLEREADHFAGSLLLPNKALTRRVERRGFLTLQEILTLAHEFTVSATAAALRYTRFSEEACVAILSRNGHILYSASSEEASAIGFAWLPKQPVPRNSPTYKATLDPLLDQIVEGAMDTSQWYSHREQVRPVWEEAFRLEQTGLVLTLLALDETQR